MIDRLEILNWESRVARADMLNPHGDMATCLDDYGIFGVWSYDASVRHLNFFGKINDVLMLSPEEIEHGLPLVSFLTRLHPMDRARVEHAWHDAGSQIETRFRTIDQRGTAHQIMFCGRIERDISGTVTRGQGFAVDLTKGKIKDGLQSSQSAVNRMAEHVITLRESADGLRRPFAVALIDALMHEIGSELASYLSSPDVKRSH